MKERSDKGKKEIKNKRRRRKKKKFIFFKQKTAYEMRISDWSSDVFSSDLIREARDFWKGNLIVKGILSTSDARLCADIGVDGIVVSNHGGRQVDGAVTSLEVLPEIVRSVPELVVMMDGGIRRGSDVLKAIALGARFVFAGRDRKSTRL